MKQHVCQVTILVCNHCLANKPILQAVAGLLHIKRKFKHGNHIIRVFGCRMSTSYSHSLVRLVHRKQHQSSQTTTVRVLLLHINRTITVTLIQFILLLQSSRVSTVRLAPTFSGMSVHQSILATVQPATVQLRYYTVDALSQCQPMQSSKSATILFHGLQGNQPQSIPQQWHYGSRVRMTLHHSRSTNQHGMK